MKRGKLQLMYQALELVIGYPADGCMLRRMGSMVSSGCRDCSAFSSSSGVSPDLSRSIEATVFFFDFLLLEEGAAGVEACCAAAAAIASSLDVSEAVAPAPASLSLFMSRAACMAEVMAAAVVAEEEDGAEDASLE